MRIINQKNLAINSWGGGRNIAFIQPLQTVLQKERGILSSRGSILHNCKGKAGVSYLDSGYGDVL